MWACSCGETCMCGMSATMMTGLLFVGIAAATILGFTIYEYFFTGDDE
jgi:hypothetical protein